ncbi:hypothetical protein AAMO2058_000164200 [Amorphochlora amoebiformis]
MVINAKKDMEWIRYKDIAFCKYSGKQLDVKGILEFSKSYAKSPSRQMHYLDERSLGPRSALIYQENAAVCEGFVVKVGVVHHVVLSSIFSITRVDSC